MDTLEHVVDILRQAKAFSGRVPSKAREKASLAEILRELLPANTESLQPDIIDEPASYEGLLARLAVISNGELSPSDIQINVGRNEKLSLTFTQRQEAYSLHFKHESGTYIDERFFDALQKHCKKKLAGNFLYFAGADSINVVYVPKKAFKRINAEMLSQHSTDALATLVQMGDPYAIPWEAIAPEILEGLTKEGETLATALMKANFPETLNEYGCPRRQGILEALQGMVNVHRENAHGETPSDIAKQKGWDHLLKEMDYGIVKTQPIAAIREREKSDYSYQGDLKFAFERLDKAGLFESIYFDPDAPYQKLHISKTPDFTYGDGTLLISRYRYGGEYIGYQVFSQRRGADGWSVSLFVPAGNVDQLCELIERYCKQGLSA
ncbi:hypothetical protein [Pseudomonas argentinensis]|uniref:hypothetical protein n=1 Tax=Phytopseudomonas argentinensis TaxID=289370 RepID=UPI0008A87CA3|nr:hypothetical protein [Pseudomonas argentinensis]